MIELITEMTLYLVVAILIGFFIGWLFARALESKEYDLSEDDISKKVDAHNKELKELELKFEREREIAIENKKRVVELAERLRESMTTIDKKEAELIEFETVLIKAERTIEEKNKIIKELKS